MSHLDTSDVVKRLREKSDAIVLKQHVSGKSDVWKNFSVIFEKQREDSDDLTSVETLDKLIGQYMCT